MIISLAKNPLPVFFDNPKKPCPPQNDNRVHHYIHVKSLEENVEILLFLLSTPQIFKVKY